MQVLDIDKLRERGFTNKALFSDAFLKEVEERVWEIVELFCGQFFEPREFTSDSAWGPMKLDGSGTELLPLYVPIISLDSISVEDANIGLDDVVVYNRIYPIDDRKNPKLEVTSGTFPAGKLNVTLEGTFGYVDNNGQPPAPLKEAVSKFIALEVEPLIGTNPAFAQKLRGRVVQQIQENYTVKLQAGTALSGVTLVPEIDKVLYHYRRNYDQISPRSV